MEMASSNQQGEQPGDGMDQGVGVGEADTHSETGLRIAVFGAKGPTGAARGSRYPRAQPLSSAVTRHSDQFLLRSRAKHPPGDADRSWRSWQDAARTAGSYQTLVHLGFQRRQQHAPGAFAYQLVQVELQPFLFRPIRSNYSQHAAYSHWTASKPPLALTTRRVRRVLQPRRIHSSGYISAQFG
jgi:hypothetical protein